MQATRSYRDRSFEYHLGKHWAEVLLTIVVGSLGVGDAHATTPPICLTTRDTPIVSTRSLSSDYATTNDYLPGDSCPGELVIYVHGFGKTETQAIQDFNTVQLSLRHDGYPISNPVVGFSWPSNTDWASADFSARVTEGRKLARFIFHVKEEQHCQATAIRLIGHDLGSRIILGAIRALHDTPNWFLAGYKVTSVDLLGAASDPSEVGLNNRWDINQYSHEVEVEVNHFKNVFDPLDAMPTQMSIPNRGYGFTLGLCGAHASYEQGVGSVLPSCRLAVSSPQLPASYAEESVNGQLDPYCAGGTICDVTGRCQVLTTCTGCLDGLEPSPQGALVPVHICAGDDHDSYIGTITEPCGLTSGTLASDGAIDRVTSGWRSSRSVLEASFTWGMEPHFETDEHPLPSTGTSLFFRSDKDYIYPADGYLVYLDAGPSEAPSSDSIVEYEWSIYSKDDREFVTARRGAGQPREVLTLQQGNFAVTLTVRTATGISASTSQDIVVKDLLIVSIGDSLASGEGNPDEPQQLYGCGPGYICSTPPTWRNSKCHRSAYSGRAQAALSIERSDPHTSVTFLDYSCSGAGMFQGLLGPYEGIDFIDPESPLAPQLSQLAVDLCRHPEDIVHTGARSVSAGCLPVDRWINYDLTYCNENHVTNAADQMRTIDALIVSVGANDIGFSSIVAAMITQVDAEADPIVRAFYYDGICVLPTLYDILGFEIDRQLNVRHVYIGEYPDPTTQDEKGQECANLPLYDFFAGIGQPETHWARTTVLAGLNEAVHNAADRNQWIYAGGIASSFKGHGWCAGWDLLACSSPFSSTSCEFRYDQFWCAYCPTERWMRTYNDSRFTQGPLLLSEAFNHDVSTGAMHPNAQGHAAIAQKLVEEILDPGPAFLAVDGVPFPFTSELTPIQDVQGENGWLTGSCGSGSCSGDVWVTVVASDSDGISESPAPSFSMDGTAGCVDNFPYWNCQRAGLSSALTDWIIVTRRDGIHDLEFGANDLLRHSGSFFYRIKVDLSDPVASVRVVEGIGGEGAWYRSAVDLRIDGSDPPGGSGLARLEYNSDSRSIANGSPGDTVRVTGDGRHSFTVQAVDIAGRRSAQETLLFQIDTSAPVIVVPDTILVNATRPSGAQVTYSVKAFDNLDPEPNVLCSVPSGSTLPIGVSVVSCTAYDEAGNSSTSAFEVEVLGARDQLAQLIDTVLQSNTGIGTIATLTDTLAKVVDALDKNRLAEACAQLRQFVKAVRMATPSPISLQKSIEMIGSAERIMSVLDCQSIVPGIDKGHRGPH